MSYEELQTKCDRVENVSIYLQEIVDKIVVRTCSELDAYVATVRETITHSSSVDDPFLEHIVIHLASLLYVVSQARENIGVRQEVSKSIYKEVYNKCRASAKGTIADKTALAQLESQGEELAYVVYDKAYNAIKAREDAGNTLLSACKKILSRRIAEIELSKGVRQ